MTVDKETVYIYSAPYKESGKEFLIFIAKGDARLACDIVGEVTLERRYRPALRTQLTLHTCVNDKWSTPTAWTISFTCDPTAGRQYYLSLLAEASTAWNTACISPLLRSISMSPSIS